MSNYNFPKTRDVNSNLKIFYCSLVSQTVRSGPASRCTAPDFDFMVDFMSSLLLEQDPMLKYLNERNSRFLEPDFLLTVTFYLLFGCYQSFVWFLVSRTDWMELVEKLNCFEWLHVKGVTSPEWLQQRTPKHSVKLLFGQNICCRLFVFKQADKFFSFPYSKVQSSGFIVHRLTF